MTNSTFTHDALVIRTCNADGTSYNGFKYPMTVGEVATCPDWEPTPECGHGLHGLIDGCGDWGLIETAPSKVWQIVGVLRAECVDLDGDKVKFPRCVIMYVGPVGGAMKMIQAEAVRSIQAKADKNFASGDRGHAAATGYSGHAVATGDRGHAAATGDRGHAAATGYSGHAAASGDRGHAAATGYSGHAVATGDRGHAAATGDRGHAAATGYSGHAAATGYSGHAAATGDRGHAAATGDRGHAAATGYRGHAAASGYSGHAAATGDRGHAAATGYRGHAAASGYSGHAAATGDRGHAAATGDRGHAAATGAHSCSISVGIKGTAQGAVGTWLTLAFWKYSNTSHKWELKKVATSQIDGKKLKPDTPYKLSARGKFVKAT